MAVTAEVRAENRGFTRVIEHSKRQLRELKKTARSGISFGGLAVSAGVLVGLRNVAVEMDRIEKLSRQLGGTLKETQQIEFISTQNGLTLEQTVKALTQLDRRLGDISRNPRAEAALDRLGIKLVALREASPVERLYMLGEAFDAAADRGRALADIYEVTGRQAVDLQQLLEQGGQALRDLADSAPIVSDEDIRNITRMNDELDKLGKTGRAVGARALGVLNEGVDKASVGLATIMGELEALRLRFAEGGEAADDFRRIMDETLREREESKAAEREAAALAPLRTAVADLVGKYEQLKNARLDAETPAEDLVTREALLQESLLAEIEALEEQRNKMDETKETARQRLQLQEELLSRQVELEESLVREAGYQKDLAKEREDIAREDERAARDRQREEERLQRLREQATGRTDFEKIGGRFGPAPEGRPRSALDYLDETLPGADTRLPDRAGTAPGAAAAKLDQVADSNEKIAKGIEEIAKKVTGFEFDWPESQHGG